MSILEAENLTKRYGPRLALDGLNLSLAAGGVFGFLGPNGAGKTTAIRLILGLLRPTRGVVRAFGFDCWKSGHRARAEIGYLPGDLRLYSALTARSALSLFGRIRRCDLSKRGEALAELFQLDPLLRVSEMSRGTRQKLGLVLALSAAPRLVVLDEPTSGLDPVIQEKLKEHLLGMARAGHTIFFSSHTLSEVERLCERVAILREGRVVADASLEELRARAGREVRIVWSAAAKGGPDQPPPGLRIVAREDSSWRCELAGSVAPLMRWLADQDVEDLTIGMPPLDRLFQKYYEE